MDSNRISRILFLVEPEHTTRGSDLKCWICECRKTHGNKCRIELDAVLKISLRNADQVNQDDLGIRMERGNNPVAVCNPVTDEFINLSPTNDANVGRFIDCGLGFSPRTDRHKIFEPIPLPSELELPIRHLSMGVLGSDLFVCDATNLHYVDIWVLKTCSVSKSWTKLFLISKGVDELPFSLYQPINYFKNKPLLLFCKVIF
ncbi:hypothetical protein TIFTF001_054512 [Ficus carica]|uniref:F-box associated domain-containing protein n=1 Tax=Ficus carica TaxID=3494 RepID=A0AA88EHZ5_FICCA|nr:hypothetical protein TIFTF001_054512 [Ficus carica]